MGSMVKRDEQFDVVVVGGGHAGAEAAWAAANMLRPLHNDSHGRLGQVALVTLDPAKIGAMSCNPAIGGLAKGQMVREIDALGGLMGLAADATGIQFRILNASKGPAVQGPRCQSDKYAYANEVQRLLATRPNLSVIAGAVDDLLVEDGQCVGAIVTSADGTTIHTQRSKALVLTTGTFMRGLMHTGPQQTPGGRVGEKPAIGISDTLTDLGFELGRLKTGTPPRLAFESLDVQNLDAQPGDNPPTPFSDMTDEAFPKLEQRVCWITETCAASHDAIRSNIDRAPLYNGQIQQHSVGPRYCPSIEDKVVRFADRDAHHVFLEPESLTTNEIYCNGISTSLPTDVQDTIVRNMPGCERATILRYGYAVEYDMVWPHQIDATTMTKRLPGLLLAGQINGTSGYEEAAGQGYVAGVNAVLFGRGDDLIRFGRDQAYLGVLMDDLVTKTPREPYRMFTSRAEHRLLLRGDNAAMRLTELGREFGTVDDTRWQQFTEQRSALDELNQWADDARVGDVPVRRYLARPNVTTDSLLADAIGASQSLANLSPSGRSRVLATFLASVRYAGYIERADRERAKLAEAERVAVPLGFDYESVPGLRREAAQTLGRFQPTTLGQASRLAGVTPADLMIVSIALSHESDPDQE